MPPNGQKMPQRKVSCRVCGCELLRATHFTQARCEPCRKKHFMENWKGQMVRRRTEARRFRIVCHVLGWEPEQFDEMLAEMRRSPMAFRKQPETRLARRDWNAERRAAQ